MKTNLKNLSITNPNYLLCIMWKDSEGNTYRYKVWEDVGEVLFFDVPLYAGQRIKKNFRFEVWSIDGTQAAQAVTEQFLTSVLRGVDYRNGDDAKLIDDDGLVTEFGAGIAPIDNFPFDLFNGGLLPTYERWRASEITDLTAWTSTAGLSIVSALGDTLSLSDDSGLATPPAVTFGTKYNFATAAFDPFRHLSATHIFILVKVLADGLIYRFNGNSSPATPSLTSTLIDDIATTLSTEDGKSVVVDLNTWYIIEMKYAALTSGIKAYKLHDSPDATDNVLTTSTSFISGIYNIALGAFGVEDVFSVAEVVAFNNPLTTVQTQSLLEYFYNYYNFYFNLPLTFPSDSSPQPNT